jgi:hypothetical protein
LIHLPFITAGTFSLKQKSSHKIRKNGKRNQQKICKKSEYCLVRWGGCVQGSGSISKYRNHLKVARKSEKNTPKLRVIFSVAMVLKGLCPVFRVHIQIWKSRQPCKNIVISCNVTIS